MTDFASLDAAGFRGAALAMQPADVTAAAQRLGCEPAMVSAVLDVESSGHGFDAVGRPKLLPERHIMWRQLAARPDLQKQAAAAKLAYPQRGTLPYPPTSEGCYALMRQMAAIDAGAALRSCSWGISQVMGFNFTAGGYADVFAMVEACMASEANQFELMLGFIEANRLAPKLAAKDFVGFASGYNGSGAAAVYGAKLKAAYLHHAQQATDAPAKLAAPALAKPPLYPSQLSDPHWLSVRAGDASADTLNAAELAREQDGSADLLNAAELDSSADQLNAAELVRVRETSP